MSVLRKRGPLLLDIERTLDHRYATKLSGIKRLHVGENSFNYKVITSTGIQFLKIVASESAVDLRGSISRTLLAAENNVPTATPVPSVHGGYVEVFEDFALSVWDWIEGTIRVEPWDRAACEAAGGVLAKIHRVWRTEFSDVVERVKLTAWIEQQAPRIALQSQLTLDKLSNYPGRTTSFYRRAQAHVAWRVDLAAQIQKLVDRDLIVDRQMLHGDFSVLNVLFGSEGSITVTDFSSDVVGYSQYELGRVAFAPQFVSSEGDWQVTAWRVVETYARAMKVSPESLYRASATVWLLSLAESTYGLTERIESVDRDRHLDEFWTQRMIAAERLASELGLRH